MSLFLCRTAGVGRRQRCGATNLGILPNFMRARPFKNRHGVGGQVKRQISI